MGIIDDIKSNSITTLHLSEAPEEYFDDTGDFVDAISANTSITHIIFDKDFLSCAMGKQRADIVSSVGTLPNCKSVVLRDSKLMVGICVTNLAKSAKSLEVLDMENCLLQGVNSDFDKLKDALVSSSSIKSLRIHDCTAPVEEVNLSKVMENLKDGLSIEISGEGEAKVES
jgi:hypothetical protein